MPVVNRALRTRPKQVQVGDKRYGAPGGSRTSAPFVCSYAVADALARELGIDMEHAQRAVIALGKVAQQLLLRGEPVGLPHLGTLDLAEQRCRVNPTGLAKYHRKENGVAAQGHTTPFVMRRRTVRFRMPLGMRHLFTDNAIYTGDLQAHVKALREQLKQRLLKHRSGSLKHRGSQP